MEHRNIEDIKQELKSHPDYVRSSIWTKELCVDEIKSYLLSNFNIKDEGERLNKAEDIFYNNIDKIKNTIDYGYEKGFEYLCITEDIEFDVIDFDEEEIE
jgi:hypothetical protein